MNKSVPVFHRISRGDAETRSAEIFDRYCHRRWGSGKAANRRAAARFGGVNPKTIDRWRTGLTQVPAFALLMAMTFEGLDSLLDHIDPDYRG